MLRFEEIIYFKICKSYSFRINAIDIRINFNIIKHDNINKLFKNKGDDRKFHQVYKRENNISVISLLDWTRNLFRYRT